MEWEARGQLSTEEEIGGTMDAVQTEMKNDNYEVDNKEGTSTEN